jgi:hypothetical protein
VSISKYSEKPKTTKGTGLKLSWLRSGPNFRYYYQSIYFITTQFYSILFIFNKINNNKLVIWVGVDWIINFNSICLFRICTSTCSSPLTRLRRLQYLKNGMDIYENIIYNQSSFNYVEFIVGTPRYTFRIYYK